LENALFGAESGGRREIVFQKKEDTERGQGRMWKLLMRTNGKREEKKR